MVFIGGFASILDVHREPIHLQRIIGVADRQWPLGPPIGPGFPTRTLFSPRTGDFAIQLQSIKVAVEGFVGTGQGGEHKIISGLDNAVADRVVGEKIIAENDRSKVSIVSQMALNPAVGGFGLTVLFTVTVLRCDELRTQWYCPVVAVGHHGGTQHAVGIGDCVGLFVISGAALGTLNLFRVMELRAVDGDQDFVIESGKLAKGLILNQLFKRHVERRIQQLAVDVIEFFTNVVVRGNACDAEQRLTGMTVMCLLEAALVIQK